MITQEDIDAFQRFNDVDYLFNEYQDMAASTATPGIRMNIGDTQQD